MWGWLGRKCQKNMKRKQQSVTQLRKVAEKNKQFIEAVHDCLSPVKILLYRIFYHLQLKKKPFQTYASSTVQENSEFWSVIIAIDETLIEGGRYVKANIDEHTKDF